MSQHTLLSQHRKQPQKPLGNKIVALSYLVFSLLIVALASDKVLMPEI